MHRCVFCRIRLTHQSNSHEGNHLQYGRSRLHKSSRIEKNSNPIRRAASTLMLVAGASADHALKASSVDATIEVLSGPRSLPDHPDASILMKSKFASPSHRTSSALRLTPLLRKIGRTPQTRRTTALGMSTFVDALQPGSHERTRDIPNSTSAGDMRQCKSNQNLWIPKVLNCTDRPRWQNATDRLFRNDATRRRHDLHLLLFGRGGYPPDQDHHEEKERSEPIE